jgi:hypothetical protein
MQMINRLVVLLRIIIIIIIILSIKKNKKSKKLRSYVGVDNTQRFPEKESPVLFAQVAAFFVKSNSIIRNSILTIQGFL